LVRKDLAEWFKRLCTNVKIATVRVQSQYPPTQWNLMAADDAVLNKVPYIKLQATNGCKNLAIIVDNVEMIWKSPNILSAGT
jgi:hypothetical protein